MNSLNVIGLILLVVGIVFVVFGLWVALLVLNEMKGADLVIGLFIALVYSGSGGQAILKSSEFFDAALLEA